MATNKKVTIVINRNGMGHADEQLTSVLIKNYLTLLMEGDLPAYICLYAEGVKLAIDGSSVIEELRALEEAGVEVRTAFEVSSLKKGKKGFHKFTL